MEYSGTFHVLYYSGPGVQRALYHVPDTVLPAAACHVYPHHRGDDGAVLQADTAGL